MVLFSFKQCNTAIRPLLLMWNVWINSLYSGGGGKDNCASRFSLKTRQVCSRINNIYFQAFKEFCLSWRTTERVTKLKRNVPKLWQNLRVTTIHDADWTLTWSHNSRRCCDETKCQMCWRQRILQGSVEQSLCWHFCVWVNWNIFCGTKFLWDSMSVFHNLLIGVKNIFFNFGTSRLNLVGISGYLVHGKTQKRQRLWLYHKLVIHFWCQLKPKCQWIGCSGISNVDFVAVHQSELCKTRE